MPKPKHAPQDQPASEEQSATQAVPVLAMTIPEFCEAHRISTALFFKQQRKGLGPRTKKVGARTLISFEAAAEWRAQGGKAIRG